MANNGYFNGYNQPQQYQYQQPFPSATMTATTVPGRAAALNYPVAANNTAVLLDFTNGIMWVKSNDASGFTVRLTEYKLEEIQPASQTGDFVSRGEFDEWKRNADTQFNQIINSLNVLIGGKSNAPEANAKSNAVQKAV